MRSSTEFDAATRKRFAQETYGSQTIHARIIEEAHTLETKASTLLTHISMMIAVTGILFAVAEKESLAHIFLASELIIYLCLAAVCIWCQNNFDFKKVYALSKDDDEQHTEKTRNFLIQQVLIKENAVRGVQVCLYVLTACLAATIIFTV
ncbi:MAG: hypothetical protein AB8B51_16840 [Sedimentitalea sp.]